MMNRNANNLFGGVQQSSGGGVAAAFSQLAPAQLFILHQQLNAGAGVTHGFDFLTAAAAAQQQRTQLAAPSRPTVLQEEGPRAFSSSFSVNSLLGNTNMAPFLSSSPGKTTLPLNNNTQQQLATALITQHLATVMAHYRIQQQKQAQAFCQQQPQQRQALYDSNESSFQPPSKKQRSSELVCETLSPSNQPNEHVQMNSSVCSISSPSSSTSSSSSSSASAPQSTSTSSASSMLYENHDLNSFLANLHHHHHIQQQHQSLSNQQLGFNHNLDYLARVSQSIMSGSQNHQHSDSGAFSNSSDSNTISSLNDSDEFGQVHNNSENHHPNDFSNRSSPSADYRTTRQVLSAKRLIRKRNSSTYDLHNLSCPICGLALRGFPQLQAHLVAEVENLDRIKSHFPDLQGHRDHQRKRSWSGSDRPSNSNDVNTRYLNFLKIKENRELRLKNKLRLRFRESGRGLLKCPLCTESLAGCSKEHVNLHLENCASHKLSNGRGVVKRSLEATSNEHESIDDSNSFDSYEWSVHKRCRTSEVESTVGEAKEEYEDDLDVGSECHEFPMKSEEKNDQKEIAMHKQESSDGAQINSCESPIDNEVLNESRSLSPLAKDEDSGVNEDINSKLSPCSNKNDQEFTTEDVKSSHLRSMIKKQNNSRCLI